MIIDSIKTYFNRCPYLSGGHINVDFLDRSSGIYTIDPLPQEPIIKKYASGGALKQFCFIFAGRLGYGKDSGAQNAALCENIAAWIDNENKAGRLPYLSSPKTAQSIEVISSGYLYEDNVNDARYHLQCRLTYTEL